MCDCNSSFCGCNDNIISPSITPGPQGDPGASGSQIYTGAGAPSNLIGVNGDIYIDTVAPYNFYQKSGGTWL